MKETNEHIPVDSLTRTCQIIVAALIMGVLTFLAMTIFVIPDLGNPAPTAPLLTYLAVGLGLAGLVMSYVVPNLVTTNSRRQIARRTPLAKQPGKDISPSPTTPADKLEPLSQVYLNQLIIGAALNEGMAFFAAIAYMVERNPIALGVAAVLLGALIVRFPTPIERMPGSIASATCSSRTNGAT